MPWEKSYDEADVLDRAARAFWARGYEATSMADLVEATGINRGSMYTEFDDKRGLFVRALRHYDNVYRAEFLRKIAESHSAKDAVLAVFQAAASHTPGLPGGCLLVNTAQELSPHDPEIADYVSARLQDVEDFFARRISVAQSEGTVPADLHPQETAQALLGLFIGLRVLMRSDHHDNAAKSIISQVDRMLG